jgi:hypothetical protein
MATYRRNERYVFELADGNQITGEFRFALFYDEKGNVAEPPTSLVRNCFFRVAETTPDFFKYETYFEVVNYDVGDVGAAEANPINTESTVDTLVAFSIVKELYGNRAPVKKHWAVQ